MKAIHLKTEYLTNPIGIDIVRPRLFWNCEGGIKQTAYQIIGRSNEKIIFDSGKVISSKMTDIPFGVSVSSKTKVEWQVKLWDEKDQEGEWSEPASFETAFLSADEWKAKWISGNYVVHPKKRYPVDEFRKSFTVCGVVTSARLYMTACGLYCTQINGHEVAMPLAPGITDYRKRVQYQTYDVTDLLKQQNVITVQLADGWYRGSTGAWGLTNQYGKQTKFIAQLEIRYEDGREELIASDETWDWSQDGSILFADLQDGEIVDQRKVPSYSEKALVTKHDVVPVCSNNVPIAEKEHFIPTRSVTGSGKTLLDFGQNFAGYISFRIFAHAGQKIQITFGEMLDDNGELTLKNIQCTSKYKTTPLQKIAYICKEGWNTYHTKFAIFGFQYASIETDIDLASSEFTGIAVYSDFEETGFFTSSNALLNRFVEMTKWSTKSNSTDLPTDCPTRERHGWTGDAQIFFTTAAYLFDYASFARKYLKDIYDWQRKDGMLPQIVPYGGVDFYMYVMNGSVGWADAGVMIPYRFDRIYQDDAILETYYERMKKYAKFMISRCGYKFGLYSIYCRPTHVKGKYRKYLVNYGQSYGEWAEPKEVHENKWTDMVSPHPEVSTAYTSYVMRLMTEIARKLGKKEDALLFEEYAVGCAKAYQELVETKEYSLDTDRQAHLVRSLYFDLLNPAQKKYAQERLIQALDHAGWKLGTGFLSTPLILDVLEKIDISYAYRLLENEQMPGWLYMPKMHATTIWESWEGTQAQGGIASLNHYSKGAVCQWLFTTMGGIHVDGENHFTIAPKPGGSFTYANTAYNSLFGNVKSSWQKENKQYHYRIDIPSNCQATVIVEGKTMELQAGHYEF